MLNELLHIKKVTWFRINIYKKEKKMRSSKEIRERIRKKEDNLGRQLTKNERRKIEKSVIRKHRRENFIRGLFLAAGVLLGAGGSKNIR